ncbi:serine/threonine-protein kinase [Paraliomyxa miuraensis]|uniref:serine/threonine-protein kinase n=1 Tax=Paraliomyxa miuraensis TaxID=376150 RepID=UPI00224E5D59|nr:serine/threonine-protein kinase [Paraliomyxa miuraensis]MCX4245525.1 serine/threonine protein kinase [Paraliomyxa miuraensis]
MPEPSLPTPLPGTLAELLTLGLGTGGDGFEPEASLQLGEFLCACPELQLRSCLGRGGMGVVYRARQVRLDRDVAVKLMRPEVGHDPELARRFEREAKALARLDHPGIVRVHDFGQAAGVCYLVMELVDGPNLRALMEQGLSDAQAFDIVDQLCDALAYAHQQGVVHRDVKPENVLVDRRGRVRVADFGLAKLQVEPRGGATRTRRVLGTPQYMAPEQLRDPESVDQRSDIFAIGVVFYEMLTGQLPVGRFPAPSELGRGNVRLDEIVLRALESSRERRFQAASEIRAALSSIGAGSHAITSTQAEVSPRRRWWWAGGAAVMTAGGLAWGLGLAGEPVDPRPISSVRVELDAPPKSVPDAAKQRNRWPAPELAVLDPEVVGVAGIDWSELRRSPMVTRLSAVALAERPVGLVRCKEDIIDRTHKVVAAFAPTGLRELIIHGDWEPSQLQPCLDELSRARRPDGQPMPEIVESTLGPHRRLVVRRGGTESDILITIAHGEGRVLVSLREDVTAEQLDAKLAGKASSTDLRDRVIESVDLSAPIWILAEPESGLLPWGMLSLRGGIELWNELGLDVSATFSDEAAATKAQTLAQSYSNIISTVPDFPIPPRLTVTRQGVSVRVQGTVGLPNFEHARGHGMPFGFSRGPAAGSEAGGEAQEGKGEAAADAPVSPASQ